MRLYAIIHGVPIDEIGDSPNNPLTSRELLQTSSVLTALLEMLQVWTLRNFLTQSNCRGLTAHVMGCLNPTGSLDGNIQQPTDRNFHWSCLEGFRIPSSREHWSSFASRWRPFLSHCQNIGVAIPLSLCSRWLLISSLTLPECE